MRKLWMVLAVVAGLGLPQAWADTVEMANGLKIHGKVHLETNEYIILLVYNESGRVKIPRSQIKHIEYDFATKAAGIAEDDIKGQYDLGVWAFGKGMFAEAITQFEKVKGKEGAGADTLKLLAQAYERRGQLDKAYEINKEYLLGNPDDADLAKHNADLAKKLGIGGGEAKPAIKDGLEVEYRWASEKWANANTATVTVTEDKDTKNKMLCIQTQAGKQDKFNCAGQGTALDLSQSKEILFKIHHNAPEKARIAIAFVNQNNEFYESKQLGVAANAWSTQSLKIDAADFKCAKDGWAAYGHNLGGREHIKKIIFLIYSQREFTLYVDSIFFR